MNNKTLHIVILCLFALSTSAAYAAKICLCSDDINSSQQEMPCHNSVDTEKDPQSKDTDCCSGECFCNSLCTVKSLIDSNVAKQLIELKFVHFSSNLTQFFTSTVLDKIAPPPKHS